MGSERNAGKAPYLRAVAAAGGTDQMSVFRTELPCGKLPAGQRKNGWLVPVAPTVVAAAVVTATTATTATATVVAAAATTATAVVAATTAAAAKAATATTVVALVFGLVHYNRTAADLCPVQFIYCLLRLCVIGHFHKAEASAFAGELIHNNGY